MMSRIVAITSSPALKSPGPGDDELRKGAKQRHRQELRRFEEAADQLRLRPAATMVGRPEAGLPALADGGLDRHDPGVVALPELVLIGERDQETIAGGEPAPAAACRLEHAGPCREQMEDADVPQMRHRHVRVEASGRLDAVRLGVTAAEEHGAWHPIMHLISMVAFPLVYAVYTGVAEAACDVAMAAAKRKGTASVELVGELQTEWTATRIAHDSMVAFADTAQPGEKTTSEIFTHRSLVARSALRTVELALEVAGGASYFRALGLERLFRGIQGARFHPLRPADQRKLAGRVALGLPVDDRQA
jgi:hypothetical protein